MIHRHPACDENQTTRNQNPPELEGARCESFHIWHIHPEHRIPLVCLVTIKSDNSISTWRAAPDCSIGSRDRRPPQHHLYKHQFENQRNEWSPGLKTSGRYWRHFSPKRSTYVNNISNEYKWQHLGLVFPREVSQEQLEFVAWCLQTKQTNDN